MGFPCLIWPYCIQFEWYQPKYCLHFLVDGLSVKAYVPLMKPLIPNDATAKALGAGADPDREDLSLHDEILTRLRDHIVEGKFRTGVAVPHHSLCEWWAVRRPHFR